MELAQAIALMIATITVGISAGVYQLYSFVIMPGLRRTDDRTFVAAFQQIDRAIVGPYLLVFFLGALVSTALVVALHIGADQNSVLVAGGVALALQVGIVATTMTINVPLNDGIKAAGHPDRISDLRAVRIRFNEARWMAWNLFRVAASTSAFVLLVWALTS